MSNEQSNTQFTKGPWFWENGTLWAETPTALEDVATASGSGGPRKFKFVIRVHNPADRHLIAAAPDLYKALAALVLVDYDEKRTFSENMNAYDSAIKGACTALAKARGDVS